MKKLERVELIKKLIELEKIETPEREDLAAVLRLANIDAKIFRLDLWNNTEFDLMLDFKLIESSALETINGQGYRLDKIYTFNSKKHSYKDLDGVTRYYLTAIFKKPYVPRDVSELRNESTRREIFDHEQQEQERQQELDKQDFTDYSQERA